MQATTRHLLTEEPFLADRGGQDWNGRGRWPGHWITLTNSPQAPFVAGYRLTLLVNEPVKTLIHVSGDERYELFVDGSPVGRGSERGDLDHWFFETYELNLGTGSHVIAARVSSMGSDANLAAYAQMSLSHGFFCIADDPEMAGILTTGTANWEAKLLTGYEFHDPNMAWGTGANVTLHGDQLDFDWKARGSAGWAPAMIGPQATSAAGTNDNRPTRMLRAATLPGLYENRWNHGIVRHVSEPAEGPTGPQVILAANNLAGESDNWNSLLQGGSLLIAPNQRRRVIIDLENYVCGRPVMASSAGRGSSVRIHWQESLFDAPPAIDKGDRSAVEGKFFSTIWNWQDGIGDTFRPAGGAFEHYIPLWWQAGRYVELLVETADEPLDINGFWFEETRYPFENKSSFSADDPRLADIIPIMYRTLQMCSHETYMDCPYYEQLQYIGDTRLQALVSYVTSSDDRLPRKAIQMFDASRQIDGLTQSRYPTRVRQIIPPFSLWWIGMLHDFMLWRGDRGFVRARMPGARAVLDAMRSYLNADGLLQGTDGWNYMDWVPEWGGGIPPDGQDGVSSVYNLQLALILRQAAEIETWLGEPELAARNSRLADHIVATVHEKFFDQSRGLISDNLTRTSYSEHAQCLALLEGSSPVADRLAEGLLSASDLHRTTIYFSHYLFETYRLVGRTDRLINRLELWFGHIAAGLKTTIEMPEPTRSDCHAWGAHPLFHYFATILGIRPIKPGFEEVEIRPALGPLKFAEGRFPTPHGFIEASVNEHEVAVTLPAAMTGRLMLGQKTFPLHGGKNSIKLTP